MKQQRFQREKRLLDYALYFKPLLFTGILLLLMAVAFDLVGPFIISHIFDHELKEASQKALSSRVWRLIAVYLVANLLSAVTRYYSIIQLRKTANKVVQKMRNDIYQNLQRLPISFFDNLPAGKVVSRITNDTEAVQNLYVLVLSQFITSGVYLIAIYSALFFVEPVFAAACLLLLPIFYGIIWFYRSKATVYNDVIRRKISEINAMINESIQGMPIIQAFHRQKKTAEEFEDINQENYKYEKKLLILESALSHNIVGVLKTMVFIALIYYFGMRVIQGDGAASVGVLYIFVDYISKIFNQINGIMDRIGNLERSVVAADHIFRILDEKGEPVSDQILPRFRGKVDFETVSFAYQDENYVLSDVNIEVQEGQTIGLVGHTGSGKSSIMNLLLRFYDPQQGKITIDGQDIRDIPRQTLRRHMGIVLQDPYLFTGTILSNITLNNPDISREKAIEALEAVGGDRVLRNLEDGIDEKVVEKGSTLSSGQRQLISFARALAHDPAILILDEATSSIDSETEQLIQRAMEVLQRGRTTFIIAHRLSTIKNADQIILLDKGKIAERGTHQELIAKGGRYYKMYQLQSKTEQVA